MRTDGRHGTAGEKRGEVAGLRGQGLGWNALAKRFAIPPGTVSEWIKTHRASEVDGLLNMEFRCRTCGYETKLAAVRDHPDGGMRA